MSEAHSCSAPDGSAKPKQSLIELSRRNFLASLAVAAGTLGLTSIADSAQAASKKYKVCAVKDLKVGGAVSIRIAAANTLVLVTQPKKGTFRAFDQRCTHLGSGVYPVPGQKNLVCQSHGAQFDPDSGAVKRGPAKRALAKFTVTVEKNFVYVTIKS
jgi:nitrite reductase/ring-hydroxylating ferredoxin subunit